MRTAGARAAGGRAKEWADEDILALNDGSKAGTPANSGAEPQKQTKPIRRPTPLTARRLDLAVVYMLLDISECERIFSLIDQLKTQVYSQESVNRIVGPQPIAEQATE